MDVIEQVHADLWVKVSQIPVPTKNTADLEKILIKVVHAFYKLQ